MEKQERKEEKSQIFYFNEQGELVVESNKGVWVDGEQYVKMYGRFECNAKTIGIVISHLKNTPVIIQDLNRDLYAIDIEHSNVAIVNPTEQQFRQIVRCENLQNELKHIKNDNEGILKEVDVIINTIKKYNNLPWYKRIFKKIKINYESENTKKN